MMRRTSEILIWTTLATLALTGCSGTEQSDANAAPQAAQPRDPQTLAIPGTEIPPGHPPTGSTGGVSAPATGPAEIHWDTPQGWTAEAPASNMRQAQYRVAGSGGDGECIVYYFGPGQGGDPLSNAVRWAGQFSQPGGGSSQDLMKVTKLEGTGFPVTLVEVTGTYDGGMTMTDQPAAQKTGYMLLGGIAEAPAGPWFFKFTGPESTVQGQRDGFVKMMENIHASH